MAPREAPKATPKVQRTISKTNVLKSSPASLKKVLKSTTKTVEKISMKMNSAVETRQRTTSAVPKIPPVCQTPKAKENKPVPPPSSASKSAKKQTWKRRPKPAHSGVPVPEKMRQLMQKQLAQKMAQNVA